MITADSNRTQWLIGVVIALALLGALFSLVFINRENRNELTKKPSNNLDQLRKTDPSLILYEEACPPIATGIPLPQAIAAGPNGNIYVTGGQTVYAFSPSGEKLPFTIELKQEITAITVSEDSLFYLGVGDHIEVYESTGQLKSRWGSAGPKTILTSIGVHKEHVFATDLGNRTALQFDAAGRKINSFGDFVIPSYYFDLAVSPDGSVFIANTGAHRIETYSLDGNLVSWWGEYSGVDPKKFCGCCNPAHFTLLPNREGFVTCEKGITRVKVYDREGVFTGFAAGPEQFARHDRLSAAPDVDPTGAALDVTADGQGRIIVLDPLLSEIRIFTRIKDKTPES